MPECDNARTCLSGLSETFLCFFETPDEMARALSVGDLERVCYLSTQTPYHLGTENMENKYGGCWS